MARPQVTITLGCSGQKVIKRPLEGFDGSRLSGSKRYAEDSNAEDSFSYTGKRLQVSVNNSGSEYSRHSNVGENDLRLKLLRKRQAKQIELEKAQQKKRELKQKISKSFESSEVPGRFLSRNEYDSLARRAGESSQASGRFLSRNEYDSLDRRAGESPQMESVQTSYSSSTIDGLRPRSQVVATQLSGGIASSRPMGQMLRPLQPMQALASRTGLFQTSHSKGPAPMTFMAASTGIGLNPSRPMRETIAAGSSVTKAPYMDEHFTISSLLNALGLGKYAIIFQAEEVDMPALKQMGDRDLKEIGIPMGPRKKILLAMMAQSNRQAT